MNKSKRRRLISIAAGLALLPAVASATVINIWSSIGDEANFSGGSAITDPIPDPLSGSGVGIVDPSDIGNGSALFYWDDDSGSRVTSRYHTGGFTEGIQVNFTGRVASGSPAGDLLFRIGDTTSSLASGGDAAIDIRISDAGNLRYFYGGGDDSMSVGVDTNFTFSMVINAAPLLGADFSYDAGGSMTTLAPQEFDLFINGNFVTRQTTRLDETNDYDALSLARFWFLTGGSTAGSSPSILIDDWTINTETDVIGPSAVPEPSLYAAIIGLAGLAFVFLRRRK
ncbi:MAG: PEP-CTERM sorting domain-containing protein [Puniceicoccaceae bacterium]